MKATHVGLFSSLGMLLVGGAVFAVTPAGGFGATAEKRVAHDDDDRPSTSNDPIGFGDSRGTGASSGATFLAGSDVKVEGRVGHSALLASNPDETYIMLEVRGDEKSTGAAAPAALSIVIDKSGSMAGTRYTNALNAAVRAVERLRDGDSVSVVAFDTRSEKVVPLTVINPSSRQSVLTSIRGIQLGGDTCVSCGIEEGLADLKRATTGNQGIVQRMLLLSDGATNNGIRDIPGFKSLGQRAMSQGVNITTIGVDVDFDEKVLSAIATSSNGRNYFVENDTDLARVFEAEAAAVTQSVGGNAVADIDLAPGVELVRVYDRTFSRSGSRVSVPLGAIAKGELKTVLLKVRVPKGEPGSLNLASVRLQYRDLSTDKDAQVNGRLVLELVDERSKVAAIDGIVLDRVQRSDTAQALREANALFEKGKSDEARQRLQQQVAANDAARPTAKVPTERSDDVEKSRKKQNEELNRSAGTFATAAPAASAAPGSPPPAPARAEKAQVKRNAEQADAFGF